MTDSQIRRVAVLGAGAGGLASAALFAEAGLDVSLFNRSIERIAPIAEAGGVVVEGENDSDDRLVRLQRITSSASEAVVDADLVLCCVAANGQEGVTRSVAPYLMPEAIFVLAPGSAGSLIASQIFAGAGLDPIERLLVGEMMSLPRSARMTGSARVRLRLPTRNRMAAFPASRSEELFARVGKLLPFIPAKNVLDTGLNNVNFLIHPGPMLLNYAAAERSQGRLSLMNEGMTDGVLRCIDAIDAEKMEVSRALGLEILDIDTLYTQLGSGPHIYRKPGEPFGLNDQIWDRYIHEDTPFGTVMISSIGSLLGVSTPVTDAVNTLLSILEETDFVEEGRTVERLGLAEMSPDEVATYLETGRKARQATPRENAT